MFIYLLCLCIPLPVIAGAQQHDPVVKAFTLADCISYALKNQPLVLQAEIDEQVTGHSIRMQLSAGYPQAGLTFNLEHYLKAPHITSPQLARNSSTLGGTVTQNIFDRDLLLAGRTAGILKKDARQNTAIVTIQLVADVSRAYYDLLVTMQQATIINNDILRLKKSVSDTKYNYEAGTVDKTDYTRAIIALNNSIAIQKQLEQALLSKNALLRQQMGDTDTSMIVLSYNHAQLETEVMDLPGDLLSYNNRVEYQQLKTRQALLDFRMKYTRWNYLPTVSAFWNYNLVGQNRELNRVYRQWYPNSLAGITLSLPIYQSGNRLQQTRIARLNIRRLRQDFRNLELQINTQYSSAFAAYHSNLNNYLISKENEELAGIVFKTIELQYRSGIKSFLELITAETDLRTAEVNTLNALYLALSSRIDVQQAAGTITY